jgi:hypothetical protein
MSRRDDDGLFLMHSHRIECIALALYILAADDFKHYSSALHMLIGALRNSETSAAACAVEIPSRTKIYLPKLFTHISDVSLISAVVVALLPYLSLDNLSILLPLFVMFMNKTEDKGSIAIVGARLLRFSNTLHGLGILERIFWPNITSQFALTCLIPIVITSPFSNAIIRRTLHSVHDQHASFLASLIVDKYLDGAIRRRQYGNYLSSDKVFAVIPTLPFNSPKFVSVNMAHLIFNSIFGAIHTNHDVASNARSFLNSAMSTLESIRPDIALSAKRDQFCVENPQQPDAIALIDTGASLARAIGPEVYAEFLRLTTQWETGDSLDIWFIRAAARVHFHSADPSIAKQFIDRLPKILLTSDSEFRKLILVLSVLTRLFPKFPDRQIPMLFTWPVIMCCCHSNQALQTAAINLLISIIPLAMGNEGLENKSRLQATRYISEKICDSISAYEDGLKVSFTANFSYAFVLSLTPVLENVVTRPLAIDVLNVCLAYLTEHVRIAVYYTLPYIAFAAEDPQWIADSVGLKTNKCFTISEFVFRKFGKRQTCEMAEITGYLVDVLGSPHSAHRMEIIADCLIFGAKKYPHVFGSLKKVVMEKCWRMLEDEGNPVRQNKIASLAASFLCIPWEDDTLGQIGLRNGVKTIPDEALGNCLRKMIDGVAEVLRDGLLRRI